MQLIDCMVKGGEGGQTRLDREGGGIKSLPLEVRRNNLRTCAVPRGSWNGKLDGLDSIAQGMSRQISLRGLPLSRVTATWRGGWLVPTIAAHLRFFFLVVSLYDVGSNIRMTSRIATRGRYKRKQRQRKSHISLKVRLQTLP